MKSILIVDDEAHILRLVRMHLEDEGYDVETASDGVNALEAMDGRKFDAVVTDFNMPRMNGRELCDTIRERFSGKSMIVILMTSQVDPELRRWTDGLPQVDYLEKPLSLRKLSIRLAAYFEDQAEQAVG